MREEEVRESVRERERQIDGWTKKERKMDRDG